MPSDRAIIIESFSLARSSFHHSIIHSSRDQRPPLCLSYSIKLPFARPLCSVSFELGPSIDRFRGASSVDEKLITMGVIVARERFWRTHRFIGDGDRGALLRSLVTGKRSGLVEWPLFMLCCIIVVEIVVLMILYIFIAIDKRYCY